jgi:hypothetical protein
MRLRQVSIAAYRSFRKSTTLHVDPRITVILGPNDHGKSNCLSALLHLNNDAPFVEDRDLNWDCVDDEKSLPSIVAVFELTTEQIREVLGLENPQIEEHNRSLAERQAAAKSEDPAAVQDPTDSKDEPYPVLTEADVATVKVKRVGVNGELTIEASVQLYADTEKHLLNLVPRFELINPVDIKEHSLPERMLIKDTSIEDHMPNMRDVFVPAVADYAAKLLALKGEIKPDEAEFTAKFLADFDAAYNKGKVTTKVIEWAATAMDKIAGLKRIVFVVTTSLF